MQLKRFKALERHSGHRIDGNDDAIKSIKDGKLTATVAQQPVLIGQLALQAALDVLSGKQVEPSIPAELKLVTKENVNE